MKKGFTLLEILIVLVIISIIILLVTPYVTSSINDAKLARVGNDMNSIKFMIKDYYLSFFKTTSQTASSPIKTKEIYALDYASPDPFTYLEENRNLTIPKDPWGNNYSIIILTHTLPDPITIDFSENPQMIKLTKFNSINRSLFTSSTTVSYSVNANQLKINFKYKLYYKNKVSNINVQNLKIYYSSSMGQTTGTLSLNSSSLGYPDSTYYKARYRTFSALMTSSFSEMEKYNMYLVLDYTSASSNNNIVVLDIEGLKIEATLTKTVNPGGTSTDNLYFLPFDGVVEFTIKSAGPDMVFNTDDDISKNYTIKLNF